ncbi:MAG: pyridoxal phosphate-dependent aminotransferase [Alphaproteobacteria bacterium]|nr:pyridoxal phosphate-dependent aminotransferase [Alphaproteobacteria bacterium]
MMTVKQTNTEELRGQETVDEIRKGPKFRPVLHALTSNPGVEMMNYAEGKKDMITLAQGEGDSPTPDFIARAAYDAMREGHTTYGPTLGQWPLRETLSNYYQNIYGLDIPEKRIFVTSSGSTAMHLSLASLLDKGDEVVAITPIWKNLIGAIELTQAENVQVSLDFDKEQGWSLDLDKLFGAVTPKTKVILVVTPSNPTGWSANHEEMKAILDFARERNIWVLADEVYGRIVYESDHEHMRADSFLDVAQDDDLLLVVNSFSKTWSMTGWRLGWIVGPKIAEDKIRDVALYNNLCPPTFTQYGAIAALEEGEPFLKSQVDLWRSNRDLLVDRFKSLGNVDMSYPHATFYGFFKVHGQDDCKLMTKRFIDEAGVLLSPGCAFGDTAKGYVRMCFAVSERRLLEALDRMDTVLQNN